jgi:serine/threonine protein kinase
MQQHLQVLSKKSNSDQVFDLSIKSDADLKADAAMALGLVFPNGPVTPDEIKRLKAEAALVTLENDPKKPKDQNKTYADVARKQLEWFDKLTSAQKAVVMGAAQGMRKAIDENCPNKFKPATNSSGHPEVTLNGEEYEYDGELGEGGLGKVYKFKKKGSTDQYVAIKSLHNEEARLDMEREMVVHRLAMGGEDGKGHPNITAFRGAVRGPDGSLHMVMDVADGGDLDRVAGGMDFARDTGVLPPAAATVLQQHFILDAVTGLKELQAKNVTHHDIKPKNFLVKKDGTVMLADFGSGQLARDKQGTVPGKKDQTVNIPITPLVHAPEMHKMTVTGKADTYTLGVMIHRMMGGSDERRIKPEQQKKKGSDEPPTEPALGALDKLTNAMLVKDDPSKRPTLEAVANSSFLRDAQSHDPEQVAALKAASVEYARVVGKLLKIKDTDPQLKAVDPDFTLPKLEGKSLQDTINQCELEIRDGRIKAAEKEALLQDFLQKNKPTPNLQRGIDAHAKAPNRNADHIGTELNLSKEEIKALRPYIAAKDAVLTPQKKIADGMRSIEAIHKVVNKMLATDEKAQEAAANLTKAAEPFATNTEPTGAMGDITKRFNAVANNVITLGNLLPGSKVHAQLLVKMQAFMDARDKTKDPRAAVELIREMEDIVALAAADTDVEQYCKRRRELEAQATDDPSALQRIQSEMRTLQDRVANKLDNIMSAPLEQRVAAVLPKIAAIKAIAPYSPSMPPLIQKLSTKHQAAADAVAKQAANHGALLRELENDVARIRGDAKLLARLQALKEATDAAETPMNKQNLRLKAQPEIEALLATLTQSVK